ncbi:MAG: glycosyltransferase family 4 protein [bacterium]|nr:glycosyltransferase family 4 protein [bacterium]
MSKPKITYIVSGLDKAPEFEWVGEHLSLVFEMEFILIGTSPDTALARFLKNRNIPSYYVSYHDKGQFVSALLSTWRILLKTRPKMVHAHLFEASLIGLAAAFLSGIKIRIYTRHHSDLHLVYFPKAVKYDKFCNFLATQIVAVSKNVADILLKQEGANPKKVKIIHHAFDWSNYDHCSETQIQILKNKYGLAAHQPVVGVVSRFTYWKGIQYIIPAFKKLLEKYPKACLVLANAKGDFSSEIMSLLSSINSDNYRIIVFEPDVAALYRCFDVFVHTPLSATAEAFGQVYLEALASNVPSVFTLSGIASECIRNGEQALVVPFKNSSEIEKAIDSILTNNTLRETLIREGYLLSRTFSLEKKIKALLNLYESTIDIRQTI